MGKESGRKEEGDRNLFFIYGLFKDAASHTNYVVLNGRVISK
jgi:hypothetical protein